MAREDLLRKLNAVCDEDSFIAFVAALGKDRADEVRNEAQKSSSPYHAGANGWENANIESFLESAAAWATDRKGSPFYEKPQNAWKRCAEILYAGKLYE